MRFADLIACMLMLYATTKGEGKIIGFLSKIESMGKYTMYLYLFYYPVRMSVGLFIPALDSASISNSFDCYFKAFVIIVVTVILMLVFLRISDLLSFKRKKRT